MPERQRISAAQMTVLADAQRLPVLQVSISCGACGNEAEHDGDTLYCSHCQLDFGNDPFDEKPGWFRDEEEKPCGHEPADPAVELDMSTVRQSWWPAGAVSCHTAMTNAPCSLPASHDDDHYHPHGWLYTFFDADGLALEDE